MKKMNGTRRDFLRTGAAASLIGVSARTLWGADAPSNRVRLCFAGVHEKGRGCGPMKLAAKMPGMEVACVCDVDLWMPSSPRCRIIGMRRWPG